MDRDSLEKRPAIIVLGSPNVGKRTLISNLVSGHPAHTEYKRRLIKHVESSSNPHMDFTEYGISDTEGSSLLGGEEPVTGINTPWFEWCLKNNIEYLEACASNPNFDKCLSVDGDSQGVERLYGALSAHMWPGMLLKSGDKIEEPSLPEHEEELSEEESDYEPEYEILSAGSAEPWDDVGWISADGPATTGQQSERDIDSLDREMETKSAGVEFEPSTSSQLHEEPDLEEARDTNVMDIKSEPEEGKAYDFEDLEHLMSEIGNMRGGLRLMPDFQRREMAAKLAMRMAAMFGDSSEGEEEIE